jgi:hypothetical protein
VSDGGESSATRNYAHRTNPSRYGERGGGFDGGGLLLLLEVETANAPAAAAAAAAGANDPGPNANAKLVVESAASTSPGVQCRGVPGHPVRGST